MRPALWRRLPLLAVLPLALVACHTYQPIALADLREGDRVRVESRTGVAFGAIVTDSIDDHCRARRLEGTVGGQRGGVLNLRTRRPPQDVDTASVDCLAFGRQAITVTVRDSTTIVKKRVLARKRTIGVVVGLIAALQLILLGMAQGRVFPDRIC